MRFFLCVTGSHCQKIWKIQIILSENVLKLAALIFDICVSIICQFMNVYHNIKLITSDDDDNHFVKSDIMYK